MKSVLAPVVALVFAASSALAQFTINTPASAVVCQPLLITWLGGTPPYFLSILPGNQPQAQALVTFPQTSATSVTWLVNIAAQTSLGLDLRDSTGAVVQSAPFSVQVGPDSSCVGHTTSQAFGTTATGGATSSVQSPSATGTTPLTTSPLTSGSLPQSSSVTGTGSAAHTGSASSTASTPAKSAGATRITGQVAAAGIIGAAMVALLG